MSLYTDIYHFKNVYCLPSSRIKAPLREEILSHISLNIWSLHIGAQCNFVEDEVTKYFGKANNANKDINLLEQRCLFRNLSIVKNHYVETEHWNILEQKETKILFGAIFRKIKNSFLDETKKSNKIE